MSYPNYYNPYVNNFMNQTPQMPSPMQPTNANTVGKVVDSLEMVRGADIPMDGQAYYFPKADGSMIYSKRWLPNCTTQIMAYMPQNEPQGDSYPSTQETSNITDFNLDERFNSLETKLDNLEKLLSVKKPTVNRKKETEDES